jgi:hypothetical protein
MDLPWPILIKHFQKKEKETFLFFSWFKIQKQSKEKKRKGAF